MILKQKHKRVILNFLKIFGTSTLVAVPFISAMSVHEKSTDKIQQNNVNIPGGKININEAKNTTPSNSVVVKNDDKTIIPLKVLTTSSNNINVNVHKTNNDYIVHNIHSKDELWDWPIRYNTFNADFYPVYNWNKVEENWLYSALYDADINGINYDDYYYYSNSYKFVYTSYYYTYVDDNNGKGILHEYLTTTAAIEASHVTQLKTTTSVEGGKRESYQDITLHFNDGQGLLPAVYTGQYDETKNINSQKEKINEQTLSGNISFDFSSLPNEKKFNLEFNVDFAKSILVNKKNQTNELDELNDVNGTSHIFTITGINSNWEAKDWQLFNEYNWGTWNVRDNDLDKDKDEITHNGEGGDWGYIKLGDYANYDADSLTLKTALYLKRNGNSIDYKFVTTGEAVNEGNQMRSVYDGSYTFTLSSVNLVLGANSNYNSSETINEILQNTFAKIDFYIDPNSKLSDQNNIERLNALIAMKINELVKGEDASGVIKANLKWFAKTNPGQWDSRLWDDKRLVVPTITSNDVNDDLKVLTVNLVFKYLLPVGNYTYAISNDDPNKKGAQIVLGQKYYANATFQRFFVNGNKLDYNPENGIITYDPVINLDPNNPWSGIFGKPQAQPGQKLVYPDMGTWYLSQTAFIHYTSPTTGGKQVENETVKVNETTLDSLNGEYNFHLYDTMMNPPKDSDIPSDSENGQNVGNKTRANNDSGGSGTVDINTYTITINGWNFDEKKDDVLFKITFVINSIPPDLGIKYRNWDPSAPILDQWQKAWVTKPTEEDPNPDYWPQLDASTGLASQTVWIKMKNEQTRNDYLPEQMKDYEHPLLYPDPVDDHGYQIFDVGGYTPPERTHPYSVYLNIDNNDVVTGLTKLGKQVKIIYVPDGVKAIGDNAFNGDTVLEQVIIPDSVESIGNYAFQNCTNLSMVNLNPNQSKLKIIGNYAFSISELKQITIPKSVTNINYCAFWKCNYLEEVVFEYESQLEEIGKWAFSGCGSLQAIEIPKNVTKIWDYAFQNCYALEQVNIPENVTRIGVETFFNCKNLYQIVIPKSVKFIGAKAFLYSGIRKFYVANETTKQLLLKCESGISGNQIYVASPYFNTQLGVLVSVTDLGKQQISLEIPNWITSIETNAFNECNKLNKVYFEIDAECSNIATGAFEGCTALQVVDLVNLNNNINFASGAFNGVASSAKYYVANNTVLGKLSNSNVNTANITDVSRYLIINNHVLTGLTGLGGQQSELVIPEGVNEIGDGAFATWKILKEITIPKSVQTMGWGAFKNCTSLKQVTFEEGSQLKNLDDTFDGCENLEKVELPKKMEWIGNALFYKCKKLKQITIPNSVTEIKFFAFYGCSSLKEITIPKSVKIINNQAFANSSIRKYYVSRENYTDIKNILLNCGSDIKPEWIIPTDVSNSFKQQMSTRMLVQNSKLIINDIVLLFEIKNGVLTGLTEVGRRQKELVVPAEVTAIGDGAFSRNTVLQKINLGINTTKIGANAFNGCSGLKQIVIAPKITTIGVGAFAGCTSLENVRIPNSVTEIGNSVFMGCPENTTYIVETEAVKKLLLNAQSDINPDHVVVYAGVFSNKPLSEQVDWGFIAEGSISPKGIQWSALGNVKAKTSYFTQANPNLTIANQASTMVSVEGTSKDPWEYFDKAGVWKFTSENEHADWLFNHYVAIGTNIPKDMTFCQYVNWKFHEAFPNVKEDIAVPFWETIHGSHLADYLHSQQGFTQKQIRSLTPSQVQAWWRVYVKTVTIEHNNTTHEHFNLNQINTDTIKVNSLLPEAGSDIESKINYVQDQIKSHFNRILSNLQLQVTLKLSEDYLIWVQQSQGWVQMVPPVKGQGSNWEFWRNFVNISKDDPEHEIRVKVKTLDATNYYITGESNAVLAKNNVNYEHIRHLSEKELNEINLMDGNDVNAVKTKVLANINQQLNTIWYADGAIKETDWILLKGVNETEVSDEDWNKLVDFTNGNNSNTSNFIVKATDASVILQGSQWITITNNVFNLSDINGGTLQINIYADKAEEIQKVINLAVSDVINKILTANKTWQAWNLQLGSDYQFITLTNEQLTSILDALNAKTDVGHNVTINDFVKSMGNRTINGTNIVVNNAYSNPRNLSLVPIAQPYKINTSMSIDDKTAYSWTDEDIKNNIVNYLRNKITQKFPDLVNETDYEIDVKLIESSVNNIKQALNAEDNRHDVILVDVVLPKSAKAIGSITLDVNNSSNNQNKEDAHEGGGGGTDGKHPDTPEGSGGEPSTTDKTLSSSSTAFISTLSVISILVIGLFSFVMFHRIRSYGGIKNMLHWNKKKHKSKQKSKERKTEELTREEAPKE